MIVVVDFHVCPFLLMGQIRYDRVTEFVDRERIAFGVGPDTYRNAEG